MADVDGQIHDQIQETSVQIRAGHMHVIEWISTQKVKDPKHLFGDQKTTKEGKAILWEQKKIMLHQGAIYHCHTLARELEEVMWFVGPMAHQVVAMNGCHRDAGHLGQQQTISLLQDQFWWPGMATWMQRAIYNCKRCIQHEGAHAEALLQIICVTAPLELLHVEFNSTETTTEFDQPSNVVNALVFCDHFTKHVMAYMTCGAKFLWQ